MSNFREVNDDILKDWLLFREDELSSLTCPEDKKHYRKEYGEPKQLTSYQGIYLAC